MTEYRLAQLNIAESPYTENAPELQEFLANIDRINKLAEESPGFVWRLQTEEGDATSLKPLGEQVFVNLSVWEDLSCLRTFVYNTEHRHFLNRRAQWFIRRPTAHLVLWWIDRDHLPTIEEAIARLGLLQEKGPTAQAFDFGYALRNS
ncbi:DUF3291 domain-containing protein [Pseudomaricurvus alkylphenolicus]|uniref:DUF3291 domain-containing protein n=1 Tax=Pseudomaricurvus alkylphenolicus TaxID=1306991 RepID=UPI001420104A|nr:DUF3291 domain-containing protein [Pseudomaricurvus alkylphenolicus]NIB40484.1 DUF3291 domain-containing protein [Pseudomaricurvus alkylphenolicus]